MPSNLISFSISKHGKKASNRPFAVIRLPFSVPAHVIVHNPFGIQRKRRGGDHLERGTPHLVPEGQRCLRQGERRAGFVDVPGRQQRLERCLLGELHVEELREERQ